jgi:hypothetical protein
MESFLKERTILHVDYTKDQTIVKVPLAVLFGFLLFQVLLPLNMIIFLRFTPILVYVLGFSSFVLYTLKNDIMEFVKVHFCKKSDKDDDDYYRFCQVSEVGGDDTGDDVSMVPEPTIPEIPQEDDDDKKILKIIKIQVEENFRENNILFKKEYLDDIFDNVEGVLLYNKSCKSSFIGKIVDNVKSAREDGRCKNGEACMFSHEEIDISELDIESIIAHTICRLGEMNECGLDEN